MEAYCEGDLWLRLARHANAMADRLAAGLAALGVPPVWPVEANEVFAVLPAHMDARLKREGALYHPWRTQALSPGTKIPSHASLVRLVSSFATRHEEVDRFIAIAAAAA